VILPEPSQWLKDNWPGTNPKVIFIDIDETMVHCIDYKDNQNMKAQVQLTVKLDNSLKIDINVRPGLKDCLKILKQSYQLVSFTASDQLYADTILDFLDPYHDLFSARLYRQHCVETEYGMVKDLRIIKNRDLKDLLIVDNSTLSFGFNVLNGVPILPFYDNQNDEELRHLTYYLVGLKDVAVDDIRIQNDQAFGLTRLAPVNNGEPQINEMQ
jgi:CTD small phosphatase-like protein 2